MLTDIFFRYNANMTGTFGGHCLLNAEARAKRLESEAKAEVSLKIRDYNWLQSTGQTIIDNNPSKTSTQINVKKRLTEISALWERLNGLSNLRAEKRTSLTQFKSELGRRLEEIRVWLSGVETALEAPMVLEKGSKKAVDKVLKQYDAIQLDVQKQSSNVGEVLNLCELLLQDPMIDCLGLDNGEFASAVQAVERR